LKLAQVDKSTAIATNGAMTRAGVARAVRQPQASIQRSASVLGAIDILNRVSSDVQNTPGHPQYAISARLAEKECVVRAVGSAVPESAAGVAPLITPINLTIRVSDTAVANGITDVMKPAAVSGPLYIPDVPASRPTVSIGIDNAARTVLGEVQAKDRSKGCAISPVRQALRDCLRPEILWHTETWLRRATATVDWFHASDCAGKIFPSGAPAAHLFSIRFAPESFNMDLPAIAIDRVARRLTLEPARSEQEAQTLPRSQPSRSSPLSLVVLPLTFVTQLASRYVVNLNQFTSISNQTKRGTSLPATASAPAEEHKLVMALPQSAASRVSLAFLLSSHAAVKSPLTEPIDGKNAGATLGPHPSPVRAQPASMLVLPGLTIPVTTIRWGTSGGWATVTSLSQANQDGFPASSSEESSLSSLGCLADALRVDPAVTREVAALRLNPRRPSISLDLGVQTSAHGVPAANALPRRTGPRLPVVTTRLDGLIIAGR
jgi:hypothetical protein